MKKRLFTLLLAMALLVTCMPLTAMAAEKVDESIIYYDDFEGEKYAGVLNNNVSAAVSDEESYAGEKSLKITGYSRTYDMGPEYPLTNKAKQGHTYEVSFWAKVPEGNDPMTLRLKMSYTRNGTTSYPNIVGDREINGDLVVQASIGTLCDDQQEIIAFPSVYAHFDAMDARTKARYAESFTGNMSFREAVAAWVLEDHVRTLHRSVIAAPGGTGALWAAMNTFLDPGETV
ncbi:MAG: hypothetical protein E7403_07975, partial [Ruminococcaceae bacterium]|nr:hypothetical protein [Oscillospiraceae bacterium]